MISNQDVKFKEFIKHYITRAAEAIGCHSVYFDNEIATDLDLIDVGGIMLVKIVDTTLSDQENFGGVYLSTIGVVLILDKDTNYLTTYQSENYERHYEFVAAVTKAVALLRADPDKPYTSCGPPQINKDSCAVGADSYEVVPNNISLANKLVCGVVATIKSKKINY